MTNKKISLDGFGRRKCATEWDGGWFCDNCKRLVHWKKKSYVIENKNCCEECAKNYLTKH